MITTLKIVIIIIVSLSALISLGYLLFKITRLKKWKCVEGKCEEDIDGDHELKSDCVQECKQKQSTIKQFNMPYSCTNNYKCVPSPEGKFVSKEACQSSCQDSHIYYPNYRPRYYPQSLYYYPRRQPYYWNFGKLRHRRPKRR